MKKIVIAITILFISINIHAQKIDQLFNGYLSNMTQTGQGTTVENAITYNTFDFIGAFNNDLGQYDGSEASLLSSELFIAVTVDGSVYELKVSAISGGSILTGTVIDYSGELSALPSGAAALYVKTPNTMFPASTAGLSVELREAIDNYFKLLIDKKSSSCIRRIVVSSPHALSVGDFVTVQDEGVYTESTLTEIPNGVVVDVESQLVFSFAVCGTYNVTDFSVLGQIQWNGISDGEYIHNLTSGNTYKMYEKWGNEITIDGPYPRPSLLVGQNAITATSVTGGNIVELGGDLTKNTTINGTDLYNMTLNNLTSLLIYPNNTFVVNTSLAGSSFSEINGTGAGTISMTAQKITDLNNVSFNDIDLSSVTGNLSILSENTVSGIQKIKSIVMSNEDDGLNIKNQNQATGNYTQLSLYEDYISLKTPNVISSTAVNNQYLKLVDVTTGEVEFADVVGGSGAESLNELNDVTLTSPANNNVLKYNGSQWTEGTETDPLWSVDKPFYLGDVFLENLTTGQILTYNGTNWVNSNPASGGAVALNDITDVTLTNVQQNDVLQFNGSEWVNGTVQGGSGITGVTGSNGLTATDNGDNTFDVKLGGTLTDLTTTIETGSNTFTVNTTSGAVVISNDANSFVSVSNGNTEIKGDLFQNGGIVEFQEYGEGNNIDLNPLYLAGLNSAGRLKEVEISSLPFTEITQSNGLTITNTDNVYDIELGGTLTKPTTIEGGSNLFQVNSTGSIVLQSNINSFLAVETNSTQIKGDIIQNGGDVTFSDYGDGNISGTLSKLAGFDATGKLIDVDPTSVGGASALEDLTNVNIVSPVAGQVLKYDDVNGEWINAADATGEVGSGVTSVTANSGLTQSGTANDPIIRLGGTLGVNTGISGNDQYTFTINNVTDMLLEANNFFLQTSGIINSTATTGQVLKLVDPTTGNIEYGDDVNFANTDLTISSSRNHVISGASFVIEGTGSSIMNLTVDEALQTGESTDYNLISNKMGIFMDTNIDNILLYGDIVTSLGTVNFFDYGQGNKEADDLLVEDSGYVLAVSTNGTVIEKLGVLDNVNLTTPEDGQILSYSAVGQEWVNTDAPSVDPSSINIQDLGNVTISGVKDLQFLQYDLNTQQWINADPSFPTNQTLTITDATAELSISDGNTVDLSEAIDAQVNTLLQAGSNISLAYDNIANTLTINASGTIDDLSNITFTDNTSDAVSNVLQYNPEYETLVFGSGDNNTAVHIGQDMGWFVKNQTGTAIAKGTPVYAAGTDGTSGRITVAPMIANGTINAKYFLGVTAEEIIDGADGFVWTMGKVRGIDLSGFGAGNVLYVSPDVAGTFDNVEPTSPELKLPIGFVVNNTANGTLAVRATVGSYLSESHDVQIASAANGDVLKFDGTKWVDGTDLVDDADADATNEIQTITASNGLTATATGNDYDIKLGGTLTDPSTNVVTNGNIFSVGQTGLSFGVYPGTGQFAVKGNVQFENYGEGAKTPDPFNALAYLVGITSAGYLLDIDPSTIGGGIELGDLSATTASPGTTSLTYNNSTGAFTYTPPDLSSYLTSEVDGSITNEIQTLSISGGTSLSISGGNTVTLPSYVNEATTASNGLTEVGNDIQLGGNLTGNVNIDGLTQKSFNLSNLLEFSLSVAPDGGNISISAPSISISSESYGSIFNSTNIFGIGSTGQSFDFSFGTLKMDGYGDGNKGYSDFEGTRYPAGTEQPQYLAAFAGEGTVIEYPISSLGGGISLSDLSATTAAPGTTSLTYNSSTGQFTYTPQDLSSISEESTTASNGLTLSGSDVQLGGNLTGNVEITMFSSQDFIINHPENQQKIVMDGGSKEIILETIEGNVQFTGYGLGNKLIEDILGYPVVEESQYLAAFSTFGDLYEFPLTNFSSTENSGITVELSGSSVLFKQDAHRVQETIGATISFNSQASRIVKFDMSGLGDQTLVLSGAIDGGVYTVHFINVSGSPVITWPSNCYDKSGSQLTTTTLTSSGQMFTMYFDDDNEDGVGDFYVSTEASAEPVVYSMIISCSDESTAISSTGVKTSFAAPENMTITRVKANVNSNSGASSNMTIDFKKAGTSIMTTPMYIEGGETSSNTAAIPSAVNTSLNTISEDDILSIDLTGAGDGNATGLKVTIYYTKN